MIKLNRICLYLFFFSLNFEIWDPFQTNGFFSIARLTGIIYFLVSIPRIISSITDVEMKPILRTIWLFFGLLILMNAIHTDSFGEKFFDFTIFQNIVLFWILINHERSEPLILEKGLLVFALGSIALALLYYNGIGIEYTEGRVAVFGDNQNIIGIRMCISIVILILTVAQNKLHLNKVRYLLLLPIPVMISLLVETGSRLAILSFVLVFIIGIILFKTEKYGWKIIVLVIGIISVFLIWQFIIQNDVFRTRLLQSIYEGNLSNRDVIWKNLIPLIKGNPILGIGESGYTKFSQATYGVYASPHNVILEVLCFTGLTGLLIYFYFLFLIYKRSLLAYRREGLLLPLILLFIIFSMIVVSHVLEVKIGWAIFAYISGYSINIETQDEEVYQSSDVT